MKVAVSACLLGTPCRYDGRAKPNEAALALRDVAGLEIVAVCPESAGGLEVPRPASEVVAGEGGLRVVNSEGADVTREFVAGARATLGRVQEAGCRLAVLKAKSPSCGSRAVYDGTFSGSLVPGAGVAARLLRAKGVRVVDEILLRGCVETSHRLHPGSTPALFAETAADCPRLETERLVLRALGEPDAPAVLAYASDPDVGTGAGREPHRDLADSLRFIAAVASAPHVFGVFEKSARGGEDGGAGTGTGPCIGTVGLAFDETRENPDCMALGYALGKSSWGRGLATEAAREVVRYGFEELGLDRISARCFAFNARSRRVIEKCGFEAEGVMREALATPDGVMRDLEAFSLGRREWQEPRGDRTGVGPYAS